jgi:hypothetical protein
MQKACLFDHRHACRNRARAIVITTFAMSSTVLRLLVVPVGFTYVDGFGQRPARPWLPRSGHASTGNLKSMGGFGNG